MTERKSLKIPSINGAFLFSIAAICVGSAIFAVDDYASRLCGLSIALLGVAMCAAVGMRWHKDCYDTILDAIYENKEKP
jgi:hypothetical protein